MRPDTLKITVHPTDEPVTVEEAKAQLSIVPEVDEWDEFLAAKIAAARELVEARLGQSLAVKKFRAKWKAPTSTRLTLPYPPILVDEEHPFSVTVDGDELAEADYEIEEDAEPAYVDLEDYPAGEVVVEFWAGPAGSSATPARIKSAVLMYVEHQFTNRGVLAMDSSAELPQAFETLLASLSHAGGW
jgi:uncharacterized phiE125 gp8 family phage protein